MHKISLRHMASLVGRYLGDKAGSPLRIVDVGSMQVDERNMSYRHLFEHPGWAYTGVDISEGRNVDIVLPSPYRFPFGDESIDVVISGQTFEHVEFFWLTWQEMVRILKPGGHIFLIAPSRGTEHRFPVDCWRFLPDGFRALAAYADMEVLEVHTDGLMKGHEPIRGNVFMKILRLAKYLLTIDYNVTVNIWGDTVGAFRKPDR